MKPSMFLMIGGFVLVMILSQGRCKAEAAYLPTQCLEKTGAAVSDCWSHLDYQAMQNGVAAAGPIAGLAGTCHGEADAEKQLTEELHQLFQVIDQHHYKVAFLIPQGQVVYAAVLYDQLADEAQACFKNTHSIAVAIAWSSWRETSVRWARMSGSSSYFKKYSDDFLELKRSFLEAADTNQWVREYVLLDTDWFCTLNDPGNGPNYPDYGRLFTWDDFHKAGCDGFVNGWLEPQPGFWKINVLTGQAYDIHS